MAHQPIPFSISRADPDISRLPAGIPHRSTQIRYRPEENPFTTVFVDVTHRCNMECQNCYIPNRELPDMDAPWMLDVLGRLPRRTRIRISGGEPTLRKDLPALIRAMRALGHLPTVLTNGLKLSSPGYLKKLKQAGLRTLHVSCNGGVSDDAYEAIDGMRCAKQKLKALDLASQAHMFVTVGMVLARGVNEDQVAGLWRHVRHLRGVREVHFRSVGDLGRYMPQPPLTLAEMRVLVQTAVGVPERQWSILHEDARNSDMRVGRVKVNLTAWPDLGSQWRGRLTPDGMIEPMFEHLILNAAQGGY